MRDFRRNQQGLIMYFVVVIMAFAMVGVLWFFYANGIQSIQESVNGMLSSDHFATSNNWGSFNLANSFVNNIWVFFFIFLFLGLAYYGYNEAQRRGYGS